jgi:hypothetical protein
MKNGLGCNITETVFFIEQNDNQSPFSSDIKITVPSLSEVGLQNLQVAHTLMANHRSKGNAR